MKIAWHLLKLQNNTSHISRLEHRQDQPTGTVPSSSSSRTPFPRRTPCQSREAREQVAKIRKRRLFTCKSRRISASSGWQRGPSKPYRQSRLPG